MQIVNPTAFLFKDGFFVNLIQSGSVSFGSATYTGGTFYTQAITFPKAYSFAPYVFINVLVGKSATTFLTYGPTSVTTTGFDVEFVYGASTTTNPGYDWIAIGIGG